MFVTIEIDLSISFCHFHTWLNIRIKGGKKGRPRKSQTSEDGISNDNDQISAEGDQAYLLNDGNASSSSFDGSVHNNIGSTDPSVDIPNSLSNSENLVNAGGVPVYGASTGGAPDHIDSSVDGLPKETDSLVPDGSSTTKIKKPRRSEEFDLRFCMLRSDILHA